jgi:nucleotidyltransferase substrate binding protein (TIGR01987 family)
MELVQGIRNKQELTALRKAFTSNLITDGEGWMDMLQSRNKTSHTYNEETAEEITNAVFKRYYPLFKQLETKLSALSNEQDDPT